MSASPLKADILQLRFEIRLGPTSDVRLRRALSSSTRRMLRGVTADAAFRTNVIPMLAAYKWRDVTPEGNFAYDYAIDDGNGPVTVQVKLQRSERDSPVVKNGPRYGFGGDIFIVETQKTRTNVDGEENKTRPYRYGEFDILAVSLQPSRRRWDRYL